MTDTIAPPPATPAPAAPPVSTASRLRGIAIGLAAGIVVGMLGLQVGRWFGIQHRSAGTTPPLDAWAKVALLVAALVVLHVVLLAHELGHLIGGRLVGFRAFLLVVGPIRLERAAAGWTLHRNTSAGLWGGLAGSAPTDTHDLRRRSAVMIAGGPLASLVIGVALIAAARWLQPVGLTTSLTVVQLVASLSALIGGVASLGIAVVTLIPMHTSGFLSDGARLLRLLRGGAVAARDTAMQTIIGQSLGGVRPRDWDPALLRTALAHTDDSPLEFSAWQFAQMHALDQGRDAEAAAWLDRMLANIERTPPAVRDCVRLEAARQLALRGEIDAATVQMTLATGPVMFVPYARPLAEATLLAMTGRGAEALTMIPGIRAQLAGGIDRGGNAMLADAVDELERRAQQSPAVVLTAPSRQIQELA